MERFGLDGDFLELKRRVARLLESYIARINQYQRATALCKQRALATTTRTATKRSPKKLICVASNLIALIPSC